MMKKIIQAALLAALVCVGAGGCGREAEAETPRPAQTKKQAAPRRNLLEDTAALQAAQNALKQLPPLRGHTVYVFGNIDFFDGVRPRIELMVQSPRRADERLFYTYENGRWHQGDVGNVAPVRDPVRHLTPLNEIRFTDAAVAARTWRQKAQEIGAVWREPYHAAFILLPATQKRFWHTAELETPNAQYYLSLNLDGTVWEFKKL